MHRLITVSALALIWVFSGPTAPSKAENATLQISGKIKGSEEIALTRADLEALESHTITTETPWHDGAVTFEGPRMSNLMDKVGAEGEIAFVVALNDYSSEIPLSDFEAFDVILAYKLNGEYMDVASKGPFFIVYPYDGNPELHSELYYSRSVWQIRSIEIE